MALGATVPHWSSCLPLLLWQELWSVCLRAPVSPACSSHACTRTAACHLVLIATVTAATSVPLRSTLPCSLPCARQKAGQREKSLAARALSFLSWALPTPQFLHLGQALPRGAVGHELPEARLSPQPAHLQCFLVSPSQGHPVSEMGRWSLQLLVAMVRAELEVFRGSKPFSMNSQFRHPRNFQTATETPNQSGKVVLDCMFLGGTAKVTDWWGNFWKKRLGLDPPSLQPPILHLHPKTPRNWCMGSCLGWEWRVTRISSPGCQNICHREKGMECPRRQQLLGVRLGEEVPCWSGGQARRGLCTLMEQREGARARRPGPGPGRPTEQGCISSPTPILSTHHPKGASSHGSGPAPSCSLPGIVLLFPQSLHPARPWSLPAQLLPPALPTQLSPQALRWPKNGPHNQPWDDMSLAASGAQLPLKSLCLSFQTLGEGIGSMLLSLPAALPLSSKAAGLKPFSLSALPKCLSSNPAKHPPLQLKHPSLQVLVLSSWNSQTRETAIQPEGFMAPGR